MFKFFHAQVALLFWVAITWLPEQRRVEPLNSAAIKLVHMAACIMQVWAGDGDDEWRCVQTLTEANNW
jgi:hypothetical protein